MAVQYRMKAPLDIWMAYGGDQQAIAQAMNLGILRPEEGVLAVMEGKRASQPVLQPPQGTVAQQVMGGAPPAPANPLPAGGLGGTSPAGAPSMAPPPMGMPPEMGMAPPMGMPMSEAPPMGMADGGIASLPVPDTMFDEPTNGGFDDGYAGGGIVAFAGAGPVKGDAGADMVEEEDEEVELGPEGEVGHQLLVLGNRGKSPEDVPDPAGPYDYYGNFRDPFRMMESITELAPQSTKRREQLNTYLERTLNPEEQKKRRKEDMWAALTQLGATMATTPGTLLQAAGAGINKALPGAVAAAKERRAEERGAMAELAKNEGLTNAEARDMYRLVREGTNKYGEFNEARLSREKLEELERYKQQQDNYRTRVMAAAGITQQQIGARASMYGQDKEIQLRKLAMFNDVYSNLRQNSGLDPVYQRLFIKNPNAAEIYLRRMAEKEVERQFSGNVDLGSYGE